MDLFHSLLTADARDLVQAALADDGDWPSLASLRMTCVQQDVDGAFFFSRGRKDYRPVRRTTFVYQCGYHGHRALLCWAIMAYPASSIMSFRSDSSNPNPNPDPALSVLRAHIQEIFPEIFTQREEDVEQPADQNFDDMPALVEAPVVVPRPHRVVNVTASRAVFGMLVSAEIRAKLYE